MQILYNWLLCLERFLIVLFKYFIYIFGSKFKFKTELVNKNENFFIFVNELEKRYYVLENFIKELLFQHDCVIIPDFGGFVANMQSARINKTQNSFYPPYKELSFNRDLKHNDGLLVGYVSKAKNIGYVDAKRLVDSFSESLESKLNKGKIVNIGDVGTLMMDKEKNIQFEPAGTVNFSLESFGLEQFNFDPLEEYDVTKRIQQKFEERSSSAMTRRRTLRRLAIAVPIAAALVLIPLKTNMIDLNTDISSLNPFSKIEKVQPKKETISGNKKEVEKTESTKPVTSDRTETKVEESTKTVTEQTPVTKPETPVTNVKYYIIAGSFRSENNANTLKGQLKGEGFNPVIFRADNGFYRVGLKGFLNIDKAIRQMRNLRKRSGFEQVWVTKH